MAVLSSKINKYRLRVIAKFGCNAISERRC